MSEPTERPRGIEVLANEVRVRVGRRLKTASARRFSKPLQLGVATTYRGMRDADPVAQVVGAAVIAFGVYQGWKKRQQPVHLYTAPLDMDGSIGIRLLRKGNVIGEFPVGGVRD